MSSEKPNSLRSSSNNDTDFIAKATAIATIVIAAVSIAVQRSCCSTTSPGTQKSGETTRSGTVPVKIPVASSQNPVLSFEESAPTRETIDAGTPKEESEEETDGGTKPSLEEACATLWNADKGNTGGQFSGLANVAKAMGETEEKIEFDLEEISNTCRFRIDQLMRILKVAVEQQDSRVAGVINDYLERTCGTVTLDDSYGVQEERVDCGTLSADNPRTACEWRIKEEGITACDGKPAEEQGACFGVYLKQVEEECSGLPEGEAPRTACYRARREGGLARQTKARKIMEACPAKKAAEWGMDIDDIRILDAVARAGELATSRLHFLNPDSKPTEGELANYNMALRGVLFFSDNVVLLRKLGLKNEAELKRIYIDEVAAAMRAKTAKNQPLYSNMASLLETLWMAREILK